MSKQDKYDCDYVYNSKDFTYTILYPSKNYLIDHDPDVKSIYLFLQILYAEKNGFHYWLSSKTFNIFRCRLDKEIVEEERNLAMTIRLLQENITSKSLKGYVEDYSSIEWNNHIRSPKFNMTSISISKTIYKNIAGI